jgi:hypothetical protein
MTVRLLVVVVMVIAIAAGVMALITIFRPSATGAPAASGSSINADREPVQTVEDRIYVLLRVMSGNTFDNAAEAAAGKDAKLAEIASYGAEAIDILEKTLDSSEEERVKLNSLEALKRLGKNDEFRDRVVGIFEKVLSRPGAFTLDVCLSAAEKIASSRHPDAAAKLIAVYERGGIKTALLRTLLNNIGRQTGSDEAFRFIERVYTDKDAPDEIRLQAMTAFGDLGDERAIPYLEADLYNEKKGVRRRAMDAIQGFKAKALPILRKALEAEQDPELQDRLKKIIWETEWWQR